MSYRKYDEGAGAGAGAAAAAPAAPQFVMPAGNDANRQIAQMINFIMQEAHEKVNEIRLKTEHDFNVEKHMLVHNGKLRIQEEFAQREKDFEVQQRVARSSAVGAARVRKMKARDDLLVQLRAETAQRLEGLSASPRYGEVLRKLIVQGLVRIEEPVVEVRCRPQDVPKVKAALPGAVEEFRAAMVAAGHTVSPQLRVTVAEAPETALPAKGCAGGVLLSALGGRILCDQTLDERLRIAYEQTLPTVGAALFPSA